MRTELYDRRASKRAVNVTMNRDLVSRARAEGLNLSALSEGPVEAALARAARAKFDAEIARALIEHERYLAEYGSLADAVRALEDRALEDDDADAAE